eukprot:g3565.t1
MAADAERARWGDGGLIQKLAAGGAAGAANDFLMHPVDNIRARLQVSPCAPARPLSALVFVTKDLLRTGGISNFYQGFSSVLAFSLPCNAAYFCTYDAAKTWLESSSAHPLAEPLGGLVAQFCVSFVWTPYDIVKQRMMVSNPETATPSLFSQLGRIASNGSMFRGLQASWITWAPFSMVYFGVFESLRRQLLCRYNWEESWRTDLVAGTIAGCSGAVISQPADAVKTRMQVLESGELGAGRNFIASARELVAKPDGPKLLWRGVLGRVLWISPGTAISIAVWNGLKQ